MNASYETPWQTHGRRMGKHHTTHGRPMGSLGNYDAVETHGSLMRGAWASTINPWETHDRPTVDPGRSMGGICHLSPMDQHFKRMEDPGANEEIPLDFHERPIEACRTYTRSMGNPWATQGQPMGPHDTPTGGDPMRKHIPFETREYPWETHGRPMSQ